MYDGETRTGLYQMKGDIKNLLRDTIKNNLKSNSVLSESPDLV